jgi:hypothetical protein
MEWQAIAFQLRNHHGVILLPIIALIMKNTGINKPKKQQTGGVYEKGFSQRSAKRGSTGTDGAEAGIS